MARNLDKVARFRQRVARKVLKAAHNSSKVARNLDKVAHKTGFSSLSWLPHPK